MALEVGFVANNIQRLYQSVNIYNAVFLYDEWTDDMEILYKLLIEELEYPAMKWHPGDVYLHKSRLLMVSFEELRQLLSNDEDRDTFSLLMTAVDELFDRCLEYDMCGEMMIVRV